ncbi:hypothetical protein PVAND_013547 [Polypedilum vanderplanki]|uniref:Uncharacterized protein n=1 Tax=Polypedilum vanderplanki TaxID=319348 RepID=A0A9J6CQT5_POLVA|nr:hypothetical protein PVAND_013547 [Polypedilum vanderplanki]
MENLINFEENDNNNKERSSNEILAKNPAINHPLLINSRLSFELNNPFDKLEYKVTHSQDPFECLEMANNSAKTNGENNQDQNSITSSESDQTKDTIKITRNENSLNSSAISVSSSSSNKSQVTRCLSDSGASTMSNNDGNMSRFSSMDNILSKKQNQLLKLSLLNSPNSPLHSSSFNTSRTPDSVFLEAKKISEKLNNLNELSFEDLNNISQQLVDASSCSINLNDTDLDQLKISFLEKNPSETSPPPQPDDHNEDNKDMIKDKIQNLQEKLKMIKKGEPIEHKPKIEPLSPKESKVFKTNSEVEVDDILQRIKTLMKDNKRDEAKEQLQLLNQMLTPSANHLQASQPYVRQDTFEIDKTTGSRRYSCSAANDSHNNSNDLMEQLAKLLGAQSLDVSSLNLSGSNNNVVVIVPKMPSPMATPMKHNNPTRRSVSFSTQRPTNSTRGIENKKLSTPMKHTATNLSATATRRSAFTAPRSVTKPSNSHEQKLNIGTVRKSLIGSMDKSPSKQKSPPLKRNITTAPPRATAVRRSVSLKANVPSVTVSQATPKKSTSTNLSVNHPSAVRTSSTPTPSRRLSTAPITSRASTAASSKPSINQKRPVATQKTEFRTPYGTVTSTSKASSNKGAHNKGGSLV